MKTNPENIPSFVDMITMSRLLNLSRSRLYQLVDQGILLKPVYLIDNKRPVYTQEMVARNLEVKKQNIGMNGQVILFYSTRFSPSGIQPKTIKGKSDRTEQKYPAKTSKHTEIIDALEALGLKDVSPENIDSAIHECFPDGTEKVSEDDILREIYRFIKRQNNEHNPRA